MGIYNSNTVQAIFQYYSVIVYFCADMTVTRSPRKSRRIQGLKLAAVAQRVKVEVPRKLPANIHHQNKQRNQVSVT